MTKEAMKLALEALEGLFGVPKQFTGEGAGGVAVWRLGGFDQPRRAITALREALAEQDNTYGYTKRLAEHIFQKFYAQDKPYASGDIVWGVSDTTLGVVTQIDNMVCGLVRKAEQPVQPQQEPVAWRYLTQYKNQSVWTYCAFEPTSRETWEALYTSSPPQQNPMHPEIKKMYEDYFDKCFRESPAPQRTWMGLSDEDWNEISDMPDTFDQGVAWAQARLKDKNT